MVETNASGVGVGAVLMQHGRQLAYYSQVLPPTHKYKAVYERELMAIVWVIQKWRAYLLGRCFIVRTDQRSLKFLLEQRIIAGEYQRWIAKLLGYNFAIEYKEGSENSAADAPSRLPPAMEFGLLSTIGGINTAVFTEQIKGDEVLNGIFQSLLNNQPVPDGYALRDIF